MHIHFSGIGGIGMSALARYFLSIGESVSGSDSSESPLTDELKNEGITWISHTETIPENTDLHIYTEAIAEDDIQRQSAKKLEIPSRSYFQQLGEISQNYKTIAVCGTHGKSTVTAMTGIALSQTKIDPLVIIGTKVREFNGKNIRVPVETTLGLSLPTTFIVEACEYRGSFLNLQTFGAILTNCEHDHIDYYKTEESYLNTFREFVAKIPKEGFLIANFDDPNVVEVSESAQCKIIPVKLSEIQNPITPKVPGWHNQLNAELSFACCKELLNYTQLSENEKMKELSTFNFQLSTYKGTWRRFDILGEKDGMTVIDDYAHHPSEISATLSALKEFAGNKRMIVVFQPHQYSRTRELFGEFVESFAETLSCHSRDLRSKRDQSSALQSSVDEKLQQGGNPGQRMFAKGEHNVPTGSPIKSGMTNNSLLFITDIYEARDSEDDKKAVSSQKLVEAIAKKGVQVEYSGDYQNTLEILKKNLKENDVLITMGAGPVNQVAEKFLK